MLESLPGQCESIWLGDRTDRLPTIIDHDDLSLKVFGSQNLATSPTGIDKHETFDLRYLWRVR